MTDTSSPSNFSSQTSFEFFLNDEPAPPPQPPTRSRWRWPLFIAALIIVFFGSIATIWTVQIARSRQEEELLSYARTFVAGLETSQLEALDGTRGDVSKPEYRRIKHQLSGMRAANVRFRFLYFMGYRNGQWFFYVDSEPPSSPDTSLPGDIYVEPTENALWDWHAEEPFVYGPYRDAWGRWVSAFVPITDARGVKRFFGVDIDADAWMREIELYASLPMGISTLLLSLCAFMFIIDRQHARYINKMYDEERALWQQHQRLDLAIRASRDGVFDIVVNTGQAYYSSRFLEIIGCNRSRKKLLPFFKEFLDRLHPDDREKVIEQFQAHLISGQPFLMDFRLRHYSGEYVWVNGRGCAYLNEFGKPLRFAGFITDISEQKKLDQMKSEFVSIASHQLRSPLTAIKWFCSILTSGEMGKLTKQQISCLGEIFESNERMIQLVNDLLMVSRIERTFPLNPSKEALDVGQVVKAAISDLGTLAHKKKIHVNYFDNGKNIALVMDEEKIREVFKKVIANAIVYSSEKATVEVILMQGDDEAIVTVADQGIGIGRKDQPHVFEKFFRADSARLKEPEGNGLGLFIAKSYAEAHRGSLTFTSVPGKGTIFTVTLPLLGIPVHKS